MKHYFLLALSAAYLLNFTMGVFEIPDNLPIIGNLDELGASALLIHSLQAIRRQRIERNRETIDIHATRPGKSL